MSFLISISLSARAISNKKLDLRNVSVVLKYHIIRQKSRKLNNGHYL